MDWVRFCGMENGWRFFLGFIGERDSGVVWCCKGGRCLGGLGLYGWGYDLMECGVWGGGVFREER